MSDRIAVFNDGRIEQVGSPARGVRAPGHAVRRRLRRHVEPAARPGGARQVARPDRRLVGPAGEDPHRSPSGEPPDRRRARGRRRRARGRLRRVGDPLPRRPRRRRDAGGAAAEPADVVHGRPAAARRPRAADLEEGARVRGGGCAREPAPAAATTSTTTEVADAQQRLLTIGDRGRRGGAARRRVRDQQRRERRCRHRPRQAAGDPGAQEPGRRRGRGQHPRLGRLRRGRQQRQDRRLGDAVRAEDRLQGQRAGRQHLRRDVREDGHRRLRRRVRVRRLVAAHDLRGQGRAGQHRPAHQLRRHRAVP